MLIQEVPAGRRPKNYSRSDVGLPSKWVLQKRLQPKNARLSGRPFPPMYLPKMLSREEDIFFFARLPQFESAARGTI